MRERLPLPVRRAIRPGRLGRFLRPRPVSDDFGYDRGTPIDRHYIGSFLEEHRRDIRGAVLEVKEDVYATALGGGAVTSLDILDVDATNPEATIVADLSAADAIAGGRFDCFVLTQTLQYILDVQAALEHAHRVLAPGGVLLATVPATTRVTVEIPGLVDYWRFTAASCEALFRRAFAPGTVEIRAYGNAASACAFLMGLAAEELAPAELDVHDPRYPVLIAVRAVRG